MWLEIRSRWTDVGNGRASCQSCKGMSSLSLYFQPSLKDIVFFAMAMMQSVYKEFCIVCAGQAILLDNNELKPLCTSIKCQPSLLYIVTLLIGCGSLSLCANCPSQVKQFPQIPDFGRRRNPIPPLALRDTCRDCCSRTIPSFQN